MRCLRISTSDDRDPTVVSRRSPKFARFVIAASLSIAKTLKSDRIRRAFLDNGKTRSACAAGDPTADAACIKSHQSNPDHS
jgi:hypothetical protein